MSAATTQAELRLQSFVDERETLTTKQDTLLARIAGNEDKMPDSVQSEQLEGYRERAAVLDGEIDKLSKQIEADRSAMEASKRIRRALAGNIEGVDVDDDGIVYRTMAAYARDVILTRESQECAKIKAQFGDDAGLAAARERIQLLKRTPANTLSSDVAGLTPAQHIDQIFQVINNSRPLVASARRADLNRGQLTYPKITQRPVVAVQTSEKTEAGNQKMIATMVTATASTYLGGGDLSWQAINWSTPNALDLWFELAAADYALKTEQDAGEILQTSGFSYNVSSPLGSTPTYADWIAAIAAGAGEVYSNSGRLADTVYVSPDRFYYLAGLTTTAISPFLTVNLNLGGQAGGVTSLRLVVSRGLDSGVMIVGDSAGLLVAETPGAPVELRVVEPAIGGVEVGIIGAFEAVVVDDGAFSLITTAS